MNFDLNVDNYSIDELREMFELPDEYDSNLLDSKESIMKKSLLKHDNSETAEKTINFLLKAKNILLLNTNAVPKTKDLENNINIKSDYESVYNNEFKLKESKLEISGDHMVQERDKNPYLSSYPSQYFPGIINPLKRKTRMMNLNIDSRFRNNYYTTTPGDFNVSFHQNINNVLKMELASIELPTTFYVISKQFDNNYFYVELSETDNKKVEIAEGNYDYVGLETAINAALVNLGSPYSNIIFQVNIIENKNGTGQMLVGLSPSTETPFDFALDFQRDRSGDNNKSAPLPLKMGWIMGFRNGKYINNQNYISEGVVDLTGSKYLYLVLDDFNSNVNNSFYSVFNQSLLNKNILARITLGGSTFSIISQSNLNIVTTPREYFGPVNLQNFNIQLLDSYGRIIDFNNMDFSFCLNLTLAYDI